MKTICLALACIPIAALPAHADAPRFLKGMPTGGGSPERLATGDPLGYRPAPVPGVPGGSAGGRLFDLPVSGKGTIAAPPLLAAWRGAPDGWSPRGLDGPRGWYRPGGKGGHGGGGHGGGGQPPHHDPKDDPGVPGPLGVAVVAGAWGWARRIRRRIT
jgi:MYXO-CTERM domain-containing protein